MADGYGLYNRCPVGDGAAGVVMSDSVSIRVPATTANLGPGFDCLGMALSLWNTMRVGWSERPYLAIHGSGEGRLSLDERNLMYRSAQRVLNETGYGRRSLSIESWQEIPLSRGLGSSSAAIVGGLYGANALLDHPIDPHGLLQLAAQIEGHPDNVAPALMGGLSIAIADGDTVHAAPVPLPANLQCVAYIPDTPMATKQARSVLEPQTARTDAVFNVGRAALLVASLALDRPEYLRLATQDRLHQPQRQKVYRQMKVIFDHALAAGARGVFLSGAGSSIVAFTTREENRAFTIGYEMADAGDKSGLTGTFRVLEPAATGAGPVDQTPEA